MWKREKNGDKEVLARKKLNEIKLNEASGEIMKAHPKAIVQAVLFPVEWCHRDIAQGP